MRLILIEVTQSGVRRVSARVHNANEQRETGLLVSKLGPAIEALDRAIKATSNDRLAVNPHQS